MDLLLKRNGKNYTGWLAYTLSKTEQTFPMMNRGVPIPSEGDRRHQLKWVNNWNWDKWAVFSKLYICFRRSLSGPDFAQHRENR